LEPAGRTGSVEGTEPGGGGWAWWKGLEGWSKGMEKSKEVDWGGWMGWGCCCEWLEDVWRLDDVGILGAVEEERLALGRVGVVEPGGEGRFRGGAFIECEGEVMPDNRTAEFDEEEEEEDALLSLLLFKAGR
jgi:hypothetical protein